MMEKEGQNKQTHLLGEKKEKEEEWEKRENWRSRESC